MKNLLSTPPDPARKAISRGLRRAKLAACCAIATCVYAAGAHAQVVTIDPTNNATSVAGFAKQLAQTIQQYQIEFQTLQNMLVTAQSIGTNPSIFTSQLPMITDTTQLITAKCPGAEGVSAVTDVMNTIANSLSPTQYIVTAQQQICAQIVQLQVKEYNATATLYNKMPQYGSSLQQLVKLANSASSMGSSSAVQTQAQTYSSSLSQDIDVWQTEVKSDEAMIQSLQQQQSILARVALHGSNTILGNVVQATTLEMALKAN
ncbi:hypothetical protein [Burkholderia cepacia]|uniref:hypothetical protein n=1 Tax=Burkholderia cepacia TaxID=292 RepID=UPI00158E3404|nr:hypothetical protein [Burkholderia cepacia]